MAMIVVLSYYSDGSGQPELRFFEEGADQVQRVAGHLADCVEDWVDVEVFKVTALDRPAVRVSREEIRISFTKD